MRIYEWVGIVLLLVAGAIPRWRDFDRSAFWVDEAESTLNALTILDKGYPADTYDGIPIYENTLVDFWPGNPEYEFKDPSYSRGLAAYHGWLPLYTIAASLKAFGITPRHTFGIYPSLDERVRLTKAARLPAVLLSIALPALLFASARSMYSASAGWLALVFSSTSANLIWYGRHARYYSFAITLNALCVLFMWRMATKRRPIDVVLAAMFTVLLFHTHLTTFFGAVAFATIALVYSSTNGGHWKNAVLFCGIVAAGSVPWALATGAFEAGRNIPPAHRFITLIDVLAAEKNRIGFWAVCAFGLVVGLVVALRPLWHPPLSNSMKQARLPGALLGSWVLTSIVVFYLLIPASSFFLYRFAVSFVAPALILASIVVTALIQGLAPKFTWAPAALVLIYVVGSGRLGSLIQHPPSASEERHESYTQLISVLRGMPGSEATKIYAVPNLHLVIAAYTGLPVQSIAPIRKRFLDQYAGKVLFIDRPDFEVRTGDPLGRKQIAVAASHAGVIVDDTQLVALAEGLRSRPYREQLATRVAAVQPPLTATPPFTLALLQQQREVIRKRALSPSPEAPIPMMRGYSVRNPTEWWQTFVYRFVGVEARAGTHANYLNRLASATAMIVNGTNWVIYSSETP